MTSIISAVIGAAGAVIVCLINNNILNTKNQFSIKEQINAVNANYDKSTALIEQRIACLSDQVGKLTDLSERMIHEEEKTAQMGEVIKRLSERLDRLESDDKR